MRLYVFSVKYRKKVLNFQRANSMIQETDGYEKAGGQHDTQRKISVFNSETAGGFSLQGHGNPGGFGEAETPAPDAYEYPGASAGGRGAFENTG